MIIVWWLVVCTNEPTGTWGDTWNEVDDDFTLIYITTLSIPTMAIWYYVLTGWPLELAIAGFVFIFLLTQVFLITLSTFQE